MLIKPFAILAILSGTALPLAVLGIHSVLDARIPHCNEHLPSSVSLCSDSVTGLKYDAQWRRSGIAS